VNKMAVISKPIMFLGSNKESVGRISHGKLFKESMKVMVDEITERCERFDQNGGHQQFYHFDLAMQKEL